MGNITSDQHNMTRRAAKQKRKKVSKGLSVAAESPLQLALKERAARAKREQMQLQNEERLLKQLREKGILMFSYDPCSDPIDYDHAARVFDRNIRDIKAAIKKLPLSERKVYRWEHENGETPNDIKVFRVAVVRYPEKKAKQRVINGK